MNKLKKKRLTPKNYTGGPLSGNPIGGTHIVSGKAAKYYNRRQQARGFVVGDSVLRRNRMLSSAAQNFSPKLAPKYGGLFTITKQLSPVVYELRIPHRR